MQHFVFYLQRFYITTYALFITIALCTEVEHISEKLILIADQNRHY